MRKLKRTSLVITSLLLLAFSFSGCEKQENSSNSSSEAAESSSSSQSISDDTASVADTEYVIDNLSSVRSEYFDEDDFDDSYDNPDAEITLNGSSADIKGKGAEFSDKKIKITSGGTYLFSGTLDDGQIYVDTKEKVHIALNGVNISCSDSSPIYIKDGDNAVITVCPGTDNTLSDTVNYVYENEEENEPDAVIYSADDLSINGSGTLTITANYNEGITSKNDLRISGAAINITSAGNSIKGKDSLAFVNCAVNVTSLADGFKSTEIDKEGKGFIAIESGTFGINSAQDAIQAETDIIINNGTFKINTGNDTNSTTENNNTENNEQNNMRQMFGGRVGFMGEGNPDKTDDSEKGLKAGRSIVINEGTFNAECADDTIHANTRVEINDGTFNLSSGDDGIHGGEQLDINGGSISILKSYEGIEATAININDGNLHVVASDDGFNASEGSSDETTDSQTDRFMKGGFGDVSENCALNINGGYVYVDAGGDGLDSNGVMNISGGTVLVDGPVNDGNGALDTGTDINIIGGTLIAAGSSGMAETPSAASTQYSLAIGFEQAQSANSLICVQDESGNNIAVYSPSKEYSSVIISMPEIVQNKSYSVYSGGKCSGTEVDGLYKDGEYSEGTLLGTETTQSAVTQIGTGSLGKMGMGGMGGHGGGMKSDFRQDGNNIPTDADGNAAAPPDGFNKDDMPEMPDGMTPPDGNFGGGFGGGHHNGGMGDMMPDNFDGSHHNNMMSDGSSMSVVNNMV